ncbi:XPG domain-containing protein [Wuchereria bancrofti]|uniref:XPG domain-containing protein n=1 Tax=Wuchereria bancrofti TaxID=6293 RepID=J9EZ47_WUCBA|nr:XPG domain-containing protein [Wuchereria bancrofti]
MNITGMGIQGLWQVLEPVAEPVTLESLEGKRLAIDISIWLHQAAYGYSEHQLNAKYPHLSLVLRRLAKLLFYKIRPIFVFDGPNVPIFKKKLLRDRQVKRYVEELTMTKAQKHVLQQLASSQLHGGEQQVDELSEVFASQTKRRRVDDLFDVPIPSTSKDEIKYKDASDGETTEIIYSSFESSLSSEFDQTEFESLTTRDERVDYLLTVRDKVRGLKLREIPDDSKAFSNLQIDRLLKRNHINEQLQLLKNEALKLRVFSADGKQNCSNSTIKLAAMEGLDRLHIITDDNEVQITDKSDDLKVGAFPCDGNDDDDDDALQEAIHASLLENSAEKCSKFQMGTYSYNQESKGDMIQRLRAAFTERAQDLHHDTWSSSSSESSDEFVEIFPELSNHFSEKIDDPSSSAKTVENSTESEPKECFINDNDKECIVEKDKNVDKSHDEWAIPGSSMCINPVNDIDIFASTREEGVYKDCQNLLRICGIPFVIAPGEAEAQCCELEKLGLVQGIISDDSDVWLFGAAVVYKNMFNQKRRLQMYSMESIRNQLGLSRWEAIQIALLSGGDYTNGLEGVGVVAALELISEFATALRQVDAEPSQQVFIVVFF